MTSTSESSVLRRLGGLIFSIMVATSPILIVLLSPPRIGGIFVIGYLTGAVTAPLIFLGTLKAADNLFRYGVLNSILGVIIYLISIILISVAAAMWSIFLAE